MTPLQSSEEIGQLSQDAGALSADISNPSLQWHRLGDRSARPNAQWSQWLFDAGSLTQLLIQKSRQGFRVEVRAEEWLQLERPEDRACFGPLAHGHAFWSRKVTLIGDDTPWVLAHTLIPEFSLLSPLKQVLELNEKPLGEYLFSHPELVRSGMDITQFADHSWGRRSLFYLFDKPIMVAEFFLPAILE